MNHSRAARKINRAALLIPRSERESFTTKYLQKLSPHGDNATVASSAMHTAFLSAVPRLRFVIPIFIALVIGLFFQDFSIPVLMLAVAALAMFHGLPAQTVHRIVFLGGLVTFFCLAYFWWGFGIGFDYADRNEPVPAVAQLTGPALLVGLTTGALSCVVFIASEMYNRRA